LALGNACLGLDACTCLEKKIKNAGPLARAFGNAHLDMDACTCPERNKKCRSIGHGIWECSPGHGRMHLSGKKFKKMPVHWPWHLGMLTWTWMNASVQK
jgi:hypothetical protein